MLSVIIDARTGADRLPVLLAQLTAGAVDGLVRQVAIVADASRSEIDLLCEETGAEPHATLEAAAGAARADWLLVLPQDFRLRDGWIGALENHLAGHGGVAMVAGLGEGRLFAARPFGVLVERSRVEVGGGADLKRLRRIVGIGARRIG